MKNFTVVYDVERSYGQEREEFEVVAKSKEHAKELFFKEMELCGFRENDYDFVCVREE